MSDIEDLQDTIARLRADLAAARAEFAELAALPSPRVALLMGGPPRAEGMDASVAGAIMAKVVGYLEAIEHYLLVRYQGFPETPSEEEKRALLQHLGKGMDLLRRVSQKK